ncbi:Inner membrane protein translocase component YidC, long form [Porphyromonas crevioricanis JCM 15906]|uniref:Membrane protein insertase YidC n=1 Tax=Porphyromonas crevioricanis JCM 15906 TaxID=1305617 RepID=T1CQP0_9PORP|nr:membrane protein insertase YidC [Porphyromonas crevioricanis]GAD05398.1 Inner membrane protein translocase component YidC, long form [Porphyromonas crevioricanis JCM 15906]SJZ89819.1 YidC/Oxa1 family membrane protein insertase [Porphyromonas crevioricanis]
MDKNTLWGMLLIGAIIIGFSILNKPEETSPVIDNIPQSDTIALSQKAQQTPATTLPMDSLSADSVLLSSSMQKYGVLSGVSVGESRQITLKNELLSIAFDTKGGSPVQAELLQYKAQEDKPLYLFAKEDIRVNLPLLTIDNRLVNTEDLYFSVLNASDTSLTMRLPVDSLSHMDITYTLPRNDYRLGISIRGEGLNRLLPANMSFQDLEWTQKMRTQEKSWKFENQYTSIYYKYRGGEMESLSPTKNEAKENIKEPIRWIAFKDKYFSTVLISDNDAFENNIFEIKTFAEDSEYTKECSMRTSFPFSVNDNSQAEFTLFLGPNDYNLLRGYDAELSGNKESLELDQLVYLGASVFRWINQFLIIPTVNLLSGFVSNWGIIILLLTILIKLLLSPLTYKSYMSQAKMRVLKPQVEAINAKYPGNEQSMMLKRNQETMSLYRAAGASPMSGCLPMLLQMPFLIALYMYFPTSILLRGESFLWAKDLSTYDPILSWDVHIPIISTYFGNHISLFCLLWAITNVIYTKYTMSQSSTGQAQMPGFKYMPYIMTVMFLVFFNSNSSGLCYYYFISTLITILQYIFFRFGINEEKLLAKMEENKKRPQKKSKWVARMEQLQKQQQELQRQQRKRK